MAWIVTIVLVVGNGGYSPILGSYGLNYIFTYINIKYIYYVIKTRLPLSATKIEQAKQICKQKEYVKALEAIESVTISKEERP